METMIKEPETIVLQKNVEENGSKRKLSGDEAEKSTGFIKRPRRKYKKKDIDPTSPLGVLELEIEELLKENNLTKDDIKNDMRVLLNDNDRLPLYHRDVENVKVLRLISNGDGLAMVEHPEIKNGKQFIIVPFSFPGDIVNVKIYKTHPLYAESDLVSVVSSGPYRDDSLIACRYFGKCSGCQYQNLSYEQQMLFKKNTIENAYKFFAPELIALEKLPEISATEPSPLQLSYRTKLTPHFDLARKLPMDYPRPPLGFGSKNKNQWRPTDGGDKSVLDIEECIIGTPIINQGMKNERARFEVEYKKFRKGATILLRENTRVQTEETVAIEEAGSVDFDTKEISKTEIEIDSSKKLIKTCVTNPKQIVKEYVNGYTFEFSAGEFFQNNNSILPAVTSYVQSNLKIDDSDEPNYLVDAYCGSGLFSITCSEGVSKVIGVEVSADSVKFAERNSKLNNIENAKFIVGKAEKIFASIDFPHPRTSVILDPPRKGCDEVFLNQLSEFNPARIVYISCNVHSQARDVEFFINKTSNGGKYVVESIKGFDFFPQTHHVESVAVLRLKSE